jgi:hypothetical protein
MARLYQRRLIGFIMAQRHVSDKAVRALLLTHAGEITSLRIVSPFSRACVSPDGTTCGF